MPLSPYPIGFFHIDIAEVRTGEGKLHLFVAIDRTSKFVFAKLVEQANRVTASAFLVELIAGTNGQVERMNRTLKEATVRCKCWTENPDQFGLNPIHHTPGLNS